MFEKIYNEINEKLQDAKVQEAYSLFDELEKSIEDETQKQYFYMLKINVLTLLEKNEELNSCYDKFINEFIDSKDEQTQYYVAFALFNKALGYTKSQEHEDAIKAYDKLQENFSSTTNLDILEIVAKSMVNKASRLNDLEKYEEAIILYDEVYDLYKDRKDKVLRQAAIALNNKVSILNALNKEKESKALCEMIIEKFSHINDEMIINIVSSAEVIKDKQKYDNAF